MSSLSFRLLKGVGDPPKRNRSGVWTGLPLAELEEGDRIDITMHSSDVQAKIASVRSYCSRTARKTGHKYSVHVSTGGISIWRTS